MSPRSETTTPRNETLHRVLVIQDTLAEYPYLYLNVYVAGTDVEMRQFAGLFVRCGCTKAKTVQEADLVVFTGGEDVNPMLYGEQPNRRTRWNPSRDSADVALYEQCLELGIPMVGVCRGAQFLHVMNGGKLFQDVDNHNGTHSMYDCLNKRLLQRVSSVHHQMCIEPIKNPDFLLVGYGPNISNNRFTGSITKEIGKIRDVEAFFYRSTCCFGVQGHPEYSGYGEYALWFVNMIDHLLNTNPDCEWIDSRYRIKPTLLAEAKAMREANNKKGN